MLPPRVMQSAGALLVLVSAVGFVVLGDLEILLVGLPVGLAILAGSVVGGGPEPSTPGGEDWEEAMGTLSRVTKATSVVAAGFVVSVGLLWQGGSGAAFGVGPVDVLVVFALALLLVYGAIVAAAAILVVSHVTGRDEA